MNQGEFEVAKYLVAVFPIEIEQVFSVYKGLNHSGHLQWALARLRSHFMERAGELG